MRVFTTLIAALAIAVVGISKANAAPVFLQDYEAPGNLDEPFNLAPHISGTTEGVQTTFPGQSTTTHVPSDGANGTASSAELFIPFDATTSPGAGSWAWQVRFLSNLFGISNAQNPLFNTDGYVGYWLKVDSAVAANMLTAPTLEPAAGTSQATVGDPQAIIKDGQWHLYQWNMDDPSQFNTTFSDLYFITGGGLLGNNFLEASNIIDSIAIVSTNGANATVRIDQIGYDNAGPLIAGPTGMGPGDPFLPPLIDDDGSFVFDDFPSGRWFDPPLVGAYQFATTDGSLFTEVGLPPLDIVADADATYLVTSLLGTQPVAAGANLVFASPVEFFTVSGIAPLVDGTNPTAFPTYLAFNRSTASFTMKPVPEPASLGLIALGLAALGLSWRRGKT